MLELTTDELKIILKNYNPEALEEIEDQEKRGIKLTSTQLRLMYFNRAYGKTYMSIALLMREAIKYDELYIVVNEVRGNTVPTISILGRDELLDKRELQFGYFKKLRYFINKFYPEYKVIEVAKTELHLNRKQYI